MFEVSDHDAGEVEPADLWLRDRIVAGAGWQDMLRGEGRVRMPG